MRSGAVVVVDEPGKHPLQMAATKNDQPVKAFAAGALHRALRVTIRNRRLQWRTDDSHDFGSEDVLDREGKLLVLIADQELDRQSEMFEAPAQISQRRVTQAWLRLAVTPKLTIRRRPRSMKKRTCSDLRFQVSTVK